jgi:hypothetical protein
MGLKMAMEMEKGSSGTRVLVLKLLAPSPPDNRQHPGQGVGIKPRIERQLDPGLSVISCVVGHNG